VKVLLGPSSFAAKDDAPRKRLIDAGFELVENPFGRKLTKAELLELLPGIDAILAGLEPLDADVLEASDLRVISRCGSGMSSVDQAAAKRLGISVHNTPDAPVTAVAELTVGCLIAATRGVGRMDRALHGRAWEKRIGRQVRGSTIVVVGYGRIGRETSRLLRAFGASTIVVDPCLNGRCDDSETLPLADALRRADAVVLHCGGDERIIGAEEIALMPPGGVLCNAARGGVIDETAVAEALASGQLAGAWLDVFSSEPYDGPLCDEPNALLTPHVGSYTAECRFAMEMEAAENLIAAMRDAMGDM
jgi:D-3-phosphoglycerate dehydrogenase / 2-oxoglutarate reductase